MQKRSPSGESGSTAAERFATGRDSPVRAASSTSRFLTRIKRRSAGTLSPLCNVTISPGANPSADTAMDCPFLRAVAASGIMAASASIAFPARYSWTKPMIALMITAPNTTAASVGFLSATAKAPAASSSHPIGLLIWRQNMSQGFMPPVRARVLAP